LIAKRTVVVSESYNPYFNLSLEEHLFNNVSKDEIILYLWRNENTVVIGRNQNPWKECNLEILSKLNGKVARRLSGGGAVYHDLGNLNFTFITYEENEDLNKQLSVIIKALNDLNIEATFSGRNDILINGKKISGNAFYTDEGRYYHHGTLLYDIDVEKVTEILTPSTHKLTSKGIDSVKSRITNLKNHKNGLTINDIKESIVKSYEKHYGYINNVSYVDEKNLNLNNFVKRYSSDEWIYGNSPSFNVVIDKAFDEGKIELNISLEDGKITHCKIYTDSLFTKEFDIAENILKNLKFNKYDILKALEENRYLFSPKGKVILNRIKEIIQESVPSVT